MLHTRYDDAGVMAIARSSHENINLDPVLKYYKRAEEILKLLKTALDAIVDSEIASNEVLNTPFEELGHCVDELREQIEDWQPLLSKVNFVLQVESLLSSGLDIFQLLKPSEQHLLDELGSASLEHCIQKLKHMEYEELLSTVIKDAISDLVEGVGPSSEILVKIAEGLSLRSNQEILIEAVALEKLKENAKQSEKIEEAEYIEHIISLVTRMHERLITIKQSQSCSPVPIPADFCCPLSLELMTDPVIVASGQTYERTFIKNWFDLGLTVCPKTRQTLAHNIMIPNYTTMALIANWCESNNVKLRDPTKSSSVPRIVSSPPIETRPDLSELEAQVTTLVEDLKSTSLDSQREATLQILLLAKHNMDNRIIIANCGAISLLVELLRSTDTRVQENSVTALLNLSINDNNKTAIATANAIEPLIHVLETGSVGPKENSAATLFSLSLIEDNKVRIGRSGAIGPLVDLLGNGTPRGRKYAALALFKLCFFNENMGRIVQAGAVKHLVELMDPAAGMVHKAVAVLANLSTIPEGRTAICQEGGIPGLVKVVELGSARGKENAAAALLQLCTNSNRYCSMVLQEGAVPPLAVLSQSGTPKAKEKAQALLSYFRNHRHGNAGRG